ncbi:hypothetical protein BJX68DRAFT_244964 [Aspergillus pseudodeflectus]|uniref:Uncharacterized protein n=1 Tax=Aspergillus pseudodeflectus TaxID=176178 RepID=A0ABR4JQ20_9EURO
MRPRSKRTLPRHRPPLQQSTRWTVPPPIPTQIPRLRFQDRIRSPKVLLSSHSPQG